MNYGPELLLVAAVATVGVLHTIVPDHWVPITLIARQRGWSKSETARAAPAVKVMRVLAAVTRTSCCLSWAVRSLWCGSCSV